MDLGPLQPLGPGLQPNQPIGRSALWVSKDRRSDCPFTQRWIGNNEINCELINVDEVGGSESSLKLRSDTLEPYFKSCDLELLNCIRCSDSGGWLACADGVSLEIDFDEEILYLLCSSKRSFDDLIELIREDITSSETLMRTSVSPEEKLVVTLRYLGTDCSFGEISYNYRLGKFTVTGIVRVVCKALWKKLINKIMPEATKDLWKKIAQEFERYANFPNCIGAIDGKHIRVIKPIDSGSLYHNYKYLFSIVLLGVCDANYCFTYVDIGAYGKNSDSAIFKNSLFYKRLIEKSVNIPKPKPISNVDPTPLLYVIVGDEAFGLAENLMRPYAGKCLAHEKIIFFFFNQPPWHGHHGPFMFFVRVRTIHTSLSGWDGRDGSNRVCATWDVIWMPLRTLYACFTRGKKRLVISSVLPSAYRCCHSRLAA
ncbi:Protein ALP1-like [Eumeta japonica]|uniref:Protein ALP1-like n=1 Tax=Eumeta variegata TaxID=151549 RepID=A0A4C1T3C7_EUMVA|nr:Protein ALP1-like [Eumeta japonica]